MELVQISCFFSDFHGKSPLLHAQGPAAKQGKLALSGERTQIPPFLDPWIRAGSRNTVYLRVLGVKMGT